MALRSLLLDIAPSAVEVVSCHSLEEYKAEEGSVVHFFVSATTIFRNPDFFRSVQRRTIVFAEGEAMAINQSGFRTIDVTATEQQIVRAMLEMHHAGHPKGHQQAASEDSAPSQAQLSSRECDVLALMVKGLINKEIAERLNISLTTVVFHRNNICEKLNTRSIGRLTIYAVLNNIVSLSEL